MKSPFSFLLVLVAAVGAGVAAAGAGFVLSEDAPPAVTDAPSLRAALEALRSLDRTAESDALLDAVLAAHPWRPEAADSATAALRIAAAGEFLSLPHTGAFVEGRFVRGSWNGRLALVAERDRSRALCILDEMRPQADSFPAAVRKDFFAALAAALIDWRQGGRAWRLQQTTDLAATPETDDFFEFYSDAGFPAAGPDGAPLFSAVPERWETAANDGERWCWALARLGETNREAEAMERIAFATQSFGPATLLPREADAMDLPSLADDESAARLATGPARFRLPPDWNPILLAERAGSPRAFRALGDWFAMRRSLDRAAEAYRRGGAADSVRAILDPWVHLAVESAGHTPAAAPDFAVRFRNATNVVFELRPVDEAALAASVDALVRAWPAASVPWWRTRADVRSRLLGDRGDGTNFLGAPVAVWSLPLEPDPRHFDRVARATAPAALPAGAYLLRAAADGGNSIHALLRVADTAVVSPAPGLPVAPDEIGTTSLLVADARDGRPVEGAAVSLLRWSRRDSAGSCLFKESRGATDSNGLVRLSALYGTDGAWWWADTDLCVVSNAEGRLAVVQGGVHYGGPWADAEASRDAAGAPLPSPFLATDRPAYRPGATVRYKVWVEHAGYGPEAGARWAGERIGVVVRDPKGDDVWDKTYTADEFGGLDGAMPVAADAPLGAYRVFVRVPGRGLFDAGSFRVEEYRKPEFEVAVETADRPISLGGKAKATVRATYLFGAPVAGGTATISVTRTPVEDGWLPAGPWDWLYGAGYGFYGYDWSWHPQWSARCVRAPRRGRSGAVGLVSQPPETVVRLTVPLRGDGTAEVEWDTALARKIDGDDVDQRYDVAVSVTDAARRTIDAAGSLLATAHPFRVRVWAVRPWCRDTDTVEAHALLSGTFGGGGAVPDFEARLFRTDPATGAETELGPLAAPRLDESAPGAAPGAHWRFPAPARGHYRFEVLVRDAAGRAEASSAFFTVLSAGGDPARDLRFAPLELVPDRADYAPGDVARVALHADRADSWVFAVVRAGTDRAEPRWLRLDGKTAEIEIPIEETDRPNFFVEAVAVHDGRFLHDVRQIVVPPGDKAATVAVEAPERLAPGDEAEVTVRVAGPDGAPAPLASVALAVYDRAVDQVAGGSNVRPILPFFWGWRNRYWPQWLHVWPDDRSGGSFVLDGDRVMGYGYGFWGPSSGVLFADNGHGRGETAPAGRVLKGNFSEPGFLGGAGAAVAAEGGAGGFALGGALDRSAAVVSEPTEAPPAVALRTKFADTAFWGSFPTSVGAPRLRPVEGEPGAFRARFSLPDDAAGWRVRAWAVLPGACVGEGEAQLVAARDLLVSPALPRFLVEGDEATLAAVVHNRTDAPLEVAVTLAETNGTLAVAAPASRTLVVPARGSARADFAVRAEREGEAALVVAARAVGGGRALADGVARTVPVKRRGLRTVEPFCRVAAPGEGRAEIRFRVPAARIPEETSLSLRADDSLLPSLWAAVPWLVEYPHGCTEQTLNRFVPAVLVRKALRDTGLSLDAVAGAAGAGGGAGASVRRSDAPISRDRPTREPVTTDAELDRLVQTGVRRLGQMQLADGGWGWFSGRGEASAPHTTATVVHGLLAAREAGAAVPSESLSRGLAWLEGEQARRRAWIAEDRARRRAEAEDALVARVLAEGGAAVDPAMLDFLHEDRAALPFYAKALLGLAFDSLRDPRRDALVRDVRRHVVEDPENRTARFRFENAGWWWRWYGSDVESQAAGLLLLLRAAPNDPAVPGLAKFLAGGRAHATYWNGTRDTALALETLALFHRLCEAPGEAPGAAGPAPLRLVLDGRPLDIAARTGESVEIPAALLSAGEHVLAVESAAPARPLYLSAALRAFSLEPHIEEAGLELKVRRSAARIVERDDAAAGRDAAGRLVGRTTVVRDRVPIAPGDSIAPGDLVEVRLDIEAKNDYEYILVEDAKAAGFESLEALSGYRSEGVLLPYVEWRDDRVCLYLARLPRGTHSLSYRFRAETPGVFTALPARAEGMYVPDELCAHSSSLRLGVADRAENDTTD